jgi:cell division protein FtsW
MDMNQFVVESASSPPQRDQFLIALVFLLTGIGLVTLYSASYAFGERFYSGGLYFFSRQAVLGLFGVLLFFLGLHLPMSWVRKGVAPLVLGAMFLCILTLVPGIGVVKNGAARWIRLGPISYQPSELVKLVLPLYLAHIFAKKEDRLHSFSTAILPQALVTLIFFFLIYFQNNFSTAILIAINSLFIFFLAGVRIRYFIGAGVILLPLSSLLVLTKEHRFRRLISFLWPEWEPLGTGYQVRSSLLTIGSGGFWGKGIGQGTRKIASVPEVQSDFVFSAFAEEAGFIGVFLVFALFTLFTLRGYRAAMRAGDGFCRLFAFGLVTIVASQALLNIAVVSGALPATGIPLPFFSAGGSSLATTLLMAGLIVNISGLSGKPELSLGEEIEREVEYV